MSSDIKQALEKALGTASKAEPKPQQDNEFQRIFDIFKKTLSGKIIKTPLEEVHILDENFCYLIKLQWKNPKTNQWQDTSPSIVLPLLEARILDATQYRLEDPRRARALPSLVYLLGKPEFIYENCRHGKNGGIRGKHVYVQHHSKGQVKVAFTIYDPRLRKVVPVSSFIVTQGWLDRCTDKKPPIYCRTKATR
jgi:hypothetical protein